MKHKPVILQVRCSLAIAKEMARYDSADIISQTLVAEHDTMVEEECAGKQGWTAEDVEMWKEHYRTYDFVISCPYQATIARWHSFGVRPEIKESQSWLKI